MDDNGHSANGSATRTPGRGRLAWAGRLADVPFAVLVMALVLFFGLAAGLASIGGWVGIVAVLCLAGLMVAAVVIASDA